MSLFLSKLVRPLNFRTKGNPSLARRTTFIVALVVILMTLLSTFFTYLYLSSSTENQYLGQLEKYVTERGEREETIFALASDNETVLKEAFLKEWASSSATQEEIEAEFDRLFVKMADGATRNRPETFDGTHQVGVYVKPTIVLTAEVKRRVLTYYHLASSYGPAWHNRFQDTYFGDGDGIIVVYWPEYPTWAQDTKADYEITKEEWFYIADPTHNPTRKTAWTEVYKDSVSNFWLVSSEIPIYADGKHLANVGQDIRLNQLVDRTIKDHLNGAYNLVLRGDGRVIAHPQLMELVEQKAGDLDVNQLGDAHLSRTFDLIKSQIDPKSGELKKVVLVDEQDGEFLAVDLINGPDWYFITVVPKAVLAQTAFETARFILILGTVALLIELAVLWFVLKKLVATPLATLTRATEQVAAGDLTLKLNTSRQDELGQLAASFSLMAVAVAEREAKLRLAGEQVQVRAAELRANAQQQAAGSQQQAVALTQINTSVNELSSTATNIANLARQVKESARQVVSASQTIHETTSLAVAQSELGQNAVDQTLGASRETAQLYQDLLSQMTDLQKRNTSMRHILEVINSIAAETHLLALNAAIEAAGAGEHGERFRVVAQEVKNLAGRSSTASREVVEIIAQIEAVVSTAAKSVEAGYVKTQKFTQVAMQAGDVIKELRQVAEQAELQAGAISEAAAESLRLGQQIEVSTTQQGSASQQVLVVLSDISVAAQQTAVGSNIVSTTAGELEVVSRNLTSAHTFSVN